MAINIKIFFDTETAVFTYVVSDPETSATAIIDSVLNYNQYTGRSSTKSADEVINYIKNNKLELIWILDTHIHADHLTAAHYIKEQLGGKVAIGCHIVEVLKLWIPVFNTSKDTPFDGSQFDRLLDEDEIFKLGNVDIKVWYTPGHTPACSSYLIEDAIFVGDTIFMPDVGTARTDFPGGSPELMYESIHKILSLPDNTRIFPCHDYPPEGRGPSCLSTVKEQREKNVLINFKISKDEYIRRRNKRDEKNPGPKLLLPSIQVNLRAGTFGNFEDNGLKYVKIPVDRPPIIRKSKDS